MWRYFVSVSPVRLEKFVFCLTVPNLTSRASDAAGAPGSAGAVPGGREPRPPRAGAYRPRRRDLIRHRDDRPDVLECSNRAMRTRFLTLTHIRVGRRRRLSAILSGRGYPDARRGCAAAFGVAPR